jgi:Ca2+-transporting ATPase
MTSNSSELLTLMLGPLIGLPVALLPIHILWINLVTDGMPAISLSFEKAEKDIMNRPPRPPGETVFANGRGIHMVWVGILMAGIALSLQALAIRYGMHWQTMILNFMCLSQLCHAMAIRSNQPVFRVGIFSNKMLTGAFILTLVLQTFITYAPFMHPIFKTQSLSAMELMIVIVASLSVFVAVEIEKAVSKRMKKG